MLITLWSAVPLPISLPALYPGPSLRLTQLSIPFYLPFPPRKTNQTKINKITKMDNTNTELTKVTIPEMVTLQI